MGAKFGDFSSLCHQTPSYPWCNLFYRQLQHENPSTLASFPISANPKTAPVGINPECGIPPLNDGGSIGNIANTIACGFSFIFTIWLISRVVARKAAVGRVELRDFLFFYLLTLPFQILSTGSYLEQGSQGLVIVTAIHAALVACTFWSLLANALVATQIVEDGTLSSLIPFHLFNLFFFVATLYISLDVAFTITHEFGPSNPPEALHSAPLFVFTSVWPAAAAFLFFVIMSWIILGMLRERRPMLFYSLAGLCFVLSQLDYFLLNKIICKRTNQKIDGSFVATVLESAAVYCIYLGWRSITEETWDDDYYTG